MRSTLRVLTIFALSMVASAPMLGCQGVECGPGTTADGDQCVADDELQTDEICAEGTTLVDGSCVVDDKVCGEHTRFDADSQKCEQAPGFCGEGTTWDTSAEQCVPNTDIDCGEGTELRDGQCVPALDQICADKTEPDAQGRCVIQADACATDELLDPNSGACVATDTHCAPHTAFDADSGTCVPTAEVCDTGTTFDSGSGLCLPDACQTGDVMLDGVCVSPAEKLAANADVTETENNDPTMGGTAQALSVEPVGAAAVFTGTIEAPRDLDNDGRADQDRDTFTFDASEGDWFQLSVQSTGLPAPGFVVEGPDGFVRYSPIGSSSDAARQLVIPTSGTYSITVLPAMVMHTDGQVGPSGHADWSWVGALEQLATPTPTQASLTGAPVTGSYERLTDNLLVATGVSAGDIVTVSVDASGSDAQGWLQVWDNPNELQRQIAATPGEAIEVVVPRSGDLLLMLDWERIHGPDLDFELSGEVDVDTEYLGMLANDSTTKSSAVDIGQRDSFRYVFHVNPAQVFELALDNAQAEEVDIRLYNAAGRLLSSEDALTPLSASATPGFHYWFTESGGTFVLEVSPSASSDDLRDVALTINTVTPNDLGVVGPGTSLSTTISTPIARAHSAFHMFTANSSLQVSGAVVTPDEADADAFFYNAVNREIDAYATLKGVTFSDTTISSAGLYLLRIAADEHIPTYDLELDFVALTP
ncbi:hypothetical protein FIV42_09850 [Persicimonas caeni]|uniref:Peptidase C-terminal archaeal/bacterial domain-containing protein n=1 Tax=Persicimonas caeni TaxID=2292766 RepID=A0A4Y6PS18_PERCE|nr:hypothetical protein [Persicimonas caeni]QDG51023.1 hypothetical protein FIV42_09850 [Persicimonas caeni]QED32244.1 hypothetical protein FRD00_09845 [Persicimonas caeni]